LATRLYLVARARARACLKITSTANKLEFIYAEKRRISNE